MINNEKEIWRAHPEIDIIEVSTLGRVRTLDRMVSGKGKGTRLAKGRILKQYDTAAGYLLANIKINGKWASKYVHRLVAQTFIPNPGNLPQVNHLDCDRTNNNVENLEFCTASYNSKYREEFGNALSKPVFAINLSTLEVSHFQSQKEASRVLGIQQSNINAVIKGRLKKTGGFWIVNDDENADDTIKHKLNKIRKT